MIPGEIVIPGEGHRSTPITRAGRRGSQLTVANTGDRPVQVGSHYHFAEANPALAFDRAAADGFRLDIPAGTVGPVRAGHRRCDRSTLGARSAGPRAYRCPGLRPEDG